MSPGVGAVTPLPCSVMTAKAAGHEPAAVAFPVVTKHQKPVPPMSPAEVIGMVIMCFTRVTGDIAVKSVLIASAIHWHSAIAARPTMIAVAVVSGVTAGTTAMIVVLMMNPDRERGMATLCIIAVSGANAGISLSAANDPRVFVGMDGTIPTVGVAVKAGSFSEPKPQYFNLAN